MRTVETNDAVVTFTSDQATKDAVFEKVIEFFIKHNSFSGECIQQSDEPLIDAPNLLSDLADNVIAFNVNYK